MTEKEAIKKVKEFGLHHAIGDLPNSALTAKAFEMAVVALEKQVPQKIIFNSERDREYEDYICPNCKDILQQRRKGAMAITIYKYKFCHRCGQAIDWSE